MIGQWWANIQAFNPAQLSGLLFWLDAQDPFNNATIPADGTSISLWSDKSGNGYDATQGTGALQPIFSYNTIGAFPSMLFGGAQSMNGVPSALVANPEFSVFYVVSVTLRNTNRVFLGLGSGNGFFQTQGAGYNLGFGNSYSCFEWAGYESLYSPADDNAHYFSALRSTSSNETTLYVDNNIQTSSMGSGSPLNITANYTIGRHANMFPLFWLGSIGEIIFYSREVSNNERIRVQNYLKSKWGL